LWKSPLACLHEEFEDIVEAARISVTFLDNRIQFVEYKPRSHQIDIATECIYLAVVCEHPIISILSELRKIDVVRSAMKVGIATRTPAPSPESSHPHAPRWAIRSNIVLASDRTSLGKYHFKVQDKRKKRAIGKRKKIDR
uniref:Uncharacterized protein n=1 Tax=Pristionchus pacificus TaxID=54126 RepID=A0A2A6B2N0_PRIPA